VIASFVVSFPRVHRCGPFEAQESGEVEPLEEGLAYVSGAALTRGVAGQMGNAQRPGSLLASAFLARG
jgi:hypothetical protein